MAIETRELPLEDCEVRAEGRLLTGIVMPYGSVARATPAGPERFAPGAFEGRCGDVILNVGHDRAKPIARTGAGLVLQDTPTALRMTAELPEVRDADDALELVRTKILRGLSVEFIARRERREGGVRVVEAAQLVHIGVVSRPAYRDAEVSARSESEAAERSRYRGLKWL